MQRTFHQHRTSRRTRGATTALELVAVLVVVGIIVTAVTFALTSSNNAAREHASITQMQAAHSAGRSIAATAGGFPADLADRISVEGFTVTTGPSENVDTLSVWRATSSVAAYVVRNGDGCIGIYDHLTAGARWVRDTQAAPEDCLASLLAATPFEDIDSEATNDPRYMGLFDFGSGVPVAVPDFQISQLTGDGPRISWTPSPGPNAAAYQIVRNGDVVTRVTGTSYVDVTAAGATSYEYTVQAVNAAGEHLAPPEPKTFLTLPDTVTGLSAVVAVDTIGLVWSPSLGNVNGYRVYAAANGSDDFVLLNEGAGSTYTHTTDHPDLPIADDTEFEYRVAAYNATGESPPASIVRSTTPPPPSDVFATAIMSDVLLEWTMVRSATSYNIYRATVPEGGCTGTCDDLTVIDGVDQPAGIQPGSLVQYRDYNLGAGTEYVYYVVAINDYGTSSPSTQVFVTPFNRPTAPVLEPVTTGDQQATLTWNMLDDTAADPVDGYRIYRDGVIAAIITDHETNTFTLLGLTNDRYYSFQVSAYYSSYESPLSNVQIASPAPPPDVPNSVGVTLDQNTATVTWSAPVGTPGTNQPIIRYQVECVGVDGPPAETRSLIVDADTFSAAIGGLTPGEPYRCHVRAANAGGFGEYSAWSATIHPFTAPDTAPAILSAQGGDNQATVTWAPLTSTVATPIAGYQLYRDGVIVAIIPNATSDTYTDPTVTNGNTYAYQIAAYNAGHIGPLSVALTATAAAPPGPPVITDRDPIGPSVVVFFDAPELDGGAPIVSYEVACSSTDGGATRGTTGETSPQTISGLWIDFTYRCRVRAANINGYGTWSDYTTSFIPQYAPDTPEITDAVPGDSQMTVHWTPLQDTPERPVAGYQIYVDAVIAGIVPDPDATSHTVVGLTNGQLYAFQVAAYYAGENSALSAPVYAIPRRAPDAPSIVGITRLPAAAQVAYVHPTDDGGSNIISVDVECTAPTGSTRYVTTLTSPVVVPDLTTGATYTCRARAVNAGGAGAWSEPSESFVAIDQPPKLAIVGSQPGDSQVTIGWTQILPTAGLPIDGYLIYMDGTLERTVTDPGQWFATFTGLTNGTPYTFEVQAYNAEFTSVMSDPVTVTPNRTPAAPTVTSVAPVIEAGYAYAEVAWLDPADDGGSPIVYYILECRSTNGGSPAMNFAFPENGLTALVGYLDPGYNYECRIQAHSDFGAGAWSAWHGMTTQVPLILDAPTIVSATPADGQVTVTWQPLTPTQQMPVAGYRVYVDGDSPRVAYGSDTSSLLVFGLTNGTSYTFNVTAFFGDFESAWSTPLSATPRSTPAAPQGVSAAGGTKQVVVTWNAPPSDGGSPITDYDIEWSTTAGFAPGTGTFVENGTSTTRTFTHTGRANNTTYYYRVRAQNAAGNSVWSTIALATTHNVPQAPNAPSISEGAGQLTLSWNAPAHGGTAITDYDIEWSTSSNFAAGSGTFIENGTSTTRSYTHTGRSNGTTYYYRVRAQNAAGNGPWSGIGSGNPYTTPGAPASATISSTGYRTVTISWTPPSNNGGRGITNYRVTASDGKTCTSSGSSCTITGQTSTASYTFSVQAYNAAGWGSSRSAGSNRTIPGVNALKKSVRLVDSRNNSSYKLTANTTVVLDVDASSSVGTGAIGAALQFVTLNQAGNGYVRFWQCGSVPPTSSGNFLAGQVTSGAVVTGLDGAGRVCMRSSQTTDIIVDISAYFMPGSGFVATTPTRIVDATRTANTWYAADIITGSPSATLAYFSAAAVSPSGIGHMSFVASDGNCGNNPAPSVSGLNWPGGGTRANAVSIGVRDSGDQICYLNASGGRTILDGHGYHQSNGSAVDHSARWTTRTLTANTTQRLDIGNEHPRALAVAVTSSSGAGHLQIWGCSSTSDGPGSGSMINFGGTSAPVPNTGHIIVATHSDGGLCLRATGANASIIVDRQAYYNF